MSWGEKILKSLVPTGLDKVGGKAGEVVKSVADGSAPKKIVDAGLNAAGRGAFDLAKKIVGTPTVEQRERNNPAINVLLNRLYGAAQGANITTQQSVNSLSTSFLLEPFDNPGLQAQHIANITQVITLNVQIENFMSTGNVAAANPIISQKNNLISYFNGRLLNRREIPVDQIVFNDLNILVKAKGITLQALNQALPLFST
jgi:hypothetical protein